MQQHFEAKNEAIREQFQALKTKSPERLKTRLNLSWSNWGFGLETLGDSAARLQRAGLKFIELHGNHYGPDIGYNVDETLRILGDYGIYMQETLTVGFIKLPDEPRVQLLVADPGGKYERKPGKILPGSCQIIAIS